MVDAVVIGGGPAGLTAALFLARRGREVLVLAPGIPGGLLATIDRVEDFPGFPLGTPGYELGPWLQEQAANAGALFQMAEATGLRRSGDGWEVLTNDDVIASRSVIAATGSRPRTLGVPGEARLTGRGVSHCASCDGPLLRGRNVTVVGAGDSALQEALTLAEFAGQVVVVHRSERPMAQAVYLRRLAEHPNISLRAQAVVDEVLGDDTVTGVRLRDLGSGAAEVAATEGVFVYIGLQPNTEFLAGVVALDAGGHIPTDIWMRTGQPGLFAVGDARANAAGQAVAAAGDGATAAVAAHQYLQARGD